MIIRSYKAVVKDGKQRDLEQFLAERKALVERDFYNTEKIMNANVFSFHSELYCYIESIGEEILPNQLFSGMEEFLAKWPDGEDKYFHPMTNIFHFNEPQSSSHWARKKKPDYCFGMLAKLIPDLVSRYVFYHYQFQEEQPGAGDKYGSIFLSGDTAFYYGETPELFEPAQHTGSLTTHNTPKGYEWQKLMGSHFIWWDERFPACNILEYDWEKNGYPTGQRNHQWLYLKNIFSIC